MKVVTLALVIIFYAMPAQAKNLYLYCFIDDDDQRHLGYQLYTYKFIDGWFSDEVKYQSQTAPSLFRNKRNTDVLPIEFSAPTKWKDFCPKEKGLELDVWKINDEHVSVSCENKKINRSDNLKFQHMRAIEYGLMNGKTFYENKCHFDRAKLLHSYRLLDCDRDILNPICNDN